MLKLFSKVWFYLGKNKKKFIFVALLSIPISLLKAYQAYQIKNVIDVGFLGKGGKEEVLYQCMILLAIQLVQTPLRIFHLTRLKLMSEKISVVLREKVFEKFKKIDYLKFSNMNQGEMLGVTISDIRIFSESCRGLIVLIREPITSLGFLVVAFLQDWKLALVVLGLIPFYILILNYIGKKIKKHSGKAQKEMEGFSLKVSEAVEGNVAIKSANLNSFFLDEFKKINKTFSEAKIRSISYEEHSSPSVELLGTIFLSIILIFAQRRMSSGHLSIGEFISFFTALGLFMGPLKKINNANRAINKSIVSMKRIENVLELEESSFETIDEIGELDDFETLEFRNVSFSYDSEPVLKDINFSIEKGSKVAFVGSSGAGKSTLTMLLLGILRPTKGDILINKCNINNLSSEDLRSYFAHVAQTPYILNSGVNENLSLSKSYSSDELEKGLKLGEIDFLDLDEIEKGREGDISEQFSGGQKQRLSISRAFLSNKDVFVLDEATSALDEETESAVVKNLFAATKGKTFVSIAHRLKTIQDFDKIFVLKDGMIVESGRHESLIKENGEYYSFFKKGELRG